MKLLKLIWSKSYVKIIIFVFIFIFGFGSGFFPGRCENSNLKKELRNYTDTLRTAGKGIEEQQRIIGENEQTIISLRDNNNEFEQENSELRNDINELQNNREGLNTTKLELEGSSRQLSINNNKIKNIVEESYKLLE